MRFSREEVRHSCLTAIAEFEKELSAIEERKQLLLTTIDLLRALSATSLLVGLHHHPTGDVGECLLPQGEA